MSGKDENFPRAQGVLRGKEGMLRRLLFEVPTIFAPACQSVKSNRYFAEKERRIVDWQLAIEKANMQKRRKRKGHGRLAIQKSNQNQLSGFRSRPSLFSSRVPGHCEHMGPGENPLIGDW